MRSPTDVLRRVVGILEALGIPYMVGGSFASSIHGIPRMTQDVDLVVDMSREHVVRFAQELEGDWYFSVDAIEEAITNRSSFNIIHLDSMFKVDLFVLADRPYDRESFARRFFVSLDEAQPFQLAVCAPEELVVTKLEWYVGGGRVSDRQYRDVLGVIAVQERAGGFDRAHARAIAEQLGLADLLEEALRDAASDR